MGFYADFGPIEMFSCLLLDFSKKLGMIYMFYELPKFLKIYL
jgi:hypothetical protein